MTIEKFAGHAWLKCPDRAVSRVRILELPHKAYRAHTTEPPGRPSGQAAWQPSSTVLHSSSVAAGVQSLRRKGSIFPNSRVSTETTVLFIHFAPTCDETFLEPCWLVAGRNHIESLHCTAQYTTTTTYHRTPPSFISPWPTPTYLRHAVPFTARPDGT